MADVLQNFMEDMLIKKNEGQIDLPIGRKDEKNAKWQN
jgi:hypothetical protein